MCCFSISAGKKSMFSIKIYLGCDYHGMNRQNICTIRGNPVWKQIQKCFGREAESSFERWQDPRGITQGGAFGFGFQMPKFGSWML